MYRGVVLDAGINNIKCKTGSLDTLEAATPGQNATFMMTLDYLPRVHSAEFTNTVRSSGVKPWTSLSSATRARGWNAKGAWYCT